MRAWAASPYGYLLVKVWDGDGGESLVSTKDSLGDDNQDDCGLGNLSVCAEPSRTPAMLAARCH